MNSNLTSLVALVGIVNSAITLDCKLGDVNGDLEKMRMTPLKMVTRFEVPKELPEIPVEFRNGPARIFRREVFRVLEYEGLFQGSEVSVRIFGEVKSNQGRLQLEVADRTAT